MASAHFFNWISQLEGTHHEIYWLDVYDSGNKVKKIDFVHQFVGWRYKWDFPARHYLKGNFPKVYSVISKFNEVKLEKMFESTLEQVKPDVVHSFNFQSAAIPLISVMKRRQIKWICSSWGSDIFYYSSIKSELKELESLCSKIDYLFTDCKREYKQSLKHGFKGKFLGVFPGRGGFLTKELRQEINFNERKDHKTIIVKGNDGVFGRSHTVLKALSLIKPKICDWKIVVFGCSEITRNYIKTLFNSKEIDVYGQISHQLIIKLMGNATIYIGNSISDGMPNTLYEAIVMDVFPIQSNPGEATSEIISNNFNGLLIENPNDTKSISELILKATGSYKLINNAIIFNRENIIPSIERNFIRKKVINRYNSIELDLSISN